MWRALDNANWNTPHIIQWRDLLRSIELRNLPLRYAYRGQGNPTWRFTPSLYREGGGARASPARRGELEKDFIIEHLERFKEFYLLRNPGTVDPQLDIYQWAAIAQHQGLATPLLDWTFSPIIAIFFAIWFYDFRADPGSVRLFRIDLQKKPNDVVLLNTKLIRQNLRYYAQQGAFVYVFPHDKFSKFSRRCIDELERIGQFVNYTDIPITATMRDAILVELMGMNVTIDNLFPDGMSYVVERINWEYKNRRI